ncbi:hypothetical protein BRYFOR_06579 [Marvinbryantia formatexigens DSM 14469]|uniref:Uncharacterized protein n=1 Tax=Marvinbryantia formatexigens DSM 14469 TaxID=478749 RepID=C6LDH1_9FIRM|nr:hypothetical protein BRYFOR_06579 [Marvinbryantia formatexigens DSM 14469]
MTSAGGSQIDCKVIFRHFFHILSRFSLDFLFLYVYHKGNGWKI